MRTNPKSTRSRIIRVLVGLLIVAALLLGFIGLVGHQEKFFLAALAAGFLALIGHAVNRP